MNEPKSIAEALDAGIAAANAGGVPPAPVADDAAGGEADDTSTTGTEAGVEGAADGVPAGDEPAGAGDETGQPADGTPAADGEAASDGAGGEGDEAADKAAAEAAAAAGKKDGKPGDPPVAKKLDPINDPIPNALKKETKERIRTLANMATGEKKRADTSTAERDELIKAVTDTGASPEQYAGVLDYLELVNSGDRNKQIAAINFMYREMAALSRIAGIRVPGITTISGHADLEKAVADGKLSQELAEEIAAGRAATAHQGKVGAAQQQASDARRRYQEADAKARSDMNTLEETFSKDPLYKEKKPIIVELLNEMIKGDAKSGVPPLHPSKWAASYKKIYDTLPKTLGGTRPVVRPGNGQPQPGKLPANTPLRGQQPAGAQKKEPTSVAEALDMGIEMARGG